MEINFITQIWQEKEMFVAYSPELDVSSCGKTVIGARNNLHEAVEIFLEETSKIGTLDKILEESGFVKKENNNRIYWQPRKIISTQKECVAI